MDDLIFYTLFILFLCIIYLYISNKNNIYGRALWYDDKKLLSIHLDGKDTSQQIFDIYSLTHFASGIVIYLICNYFNYTNTSTYYIAITLGILFEILENSPYIINKYRQNKHYKNYKGDSIANIFGDMISLILGIYFSKKYTDISLYYLIISEIVLSRYNASMYDLSISGIL